MGQPQAENDAPDQQLTRVRLHDVGPGRGGLEEGRADGVDQDATELPDEESVFLTTHQLNATRDEPNGTAALLFRRVQHVVATIESRYGIELDTHGADYARFILHVKFLLQRLVSKTMLRDGDSSFYEFAVQRYPEAHACAVAVRDYVLASTGSTLTDEEMLYLIVHIERLTQRVAEADAGPSAP